MRDVLPGTQTPDPLDEPPSEVVVKETCVVAAHARTFNMQGGYAEGACSNGLGFDAVGVEGALYAYPPTNPPTQIGWVYQMVSTGARYKIQAGVEALDVSYPYPLGSQWQLPAKGTGEDSPYQPLWVPAVDGGGENWVESSANDQFRTWMMYRPPSKDGLPTV